MDLDYRIVPVNIYRGEQYEPEFLAISPNNRMPAIVDHDPQDGGEPLAVFESGAILIYLAEKTGRFLPTDCAAQDGLECCRAVGGPVRDRQGPVTSSYAADGPYAIERYRSEMLPSTVCRPASTGASNRGRYSIADMACWPWVITYKGQKVDLDAFPHVKRWYKALQQRPALRRGYDAGKELGKLKMEWDEETKRNLLPGYRPEGAPGSAA